MTTRIAVLLSLAAIITSCDTAKEPIYPVPEGLSALDGAVYLSYETISLEPTNRPEGASLIVSSVGSWAAEDRDRYADGFGPDDSSTCGNSGFEVDSIFVTSWGELFRSELRYGTDRYHALRFAYDGPDGVGDWTRPVVVRTFRPDVFEAYRIDVPFSFSLIFPAPTDRPVESGPLDVAGRLSSAGIDPDRVRLLVPEGLIEPVGSSPAAGDYSCLGFGGDFPSGHLSGWGTFIRSQCPNAIAVGAPWRSLNFDGAFYPGSVIPSPVPRRDETARLLHPDARLAVRYFVEPEANYESGVFSADLVLPLLVYADGPEGPPPTVEVVGEWPSEIPSCSVE